MISTVVLMCLLAQSTPDPLLRWMDRIAQQQLQDREKRMAAIGTVADADRRKKEVRQQILDAIGGLPEDFTPLRARVTGKIDAGGYVIEKIIYQSLPGYYITANLYRPARPGRYPGILLQAGHTQEGKAETQWLAANLALKGFVSLAFDPLGQGEREQSFDPQLQSPAAGWSVNEHIHGGAQAALLGEGLARYFLWDAKRSLDYLASRPEVDPTRLGAAGCSGGGALTTFFGAIEPRLKAVVPACFPSSNRVMFAGALPHAEMLLPQETARGLDTADFIELSSPTPWMIQATEKDFFPPAGVRLAYEEALRWYRLYGKANRIEYFVGPGPHGVPLVSREAIYRWFIRWLKDGDGDAKEQAVPMFPEQELRVTRTGHVEDEPGSRKLHQILLERYRTNRKPGTLPELQGELRRLGIPTDRTAPAVRTVDGVRLQFDSEEGITLEASLYLPSGEGHKPAVLLVGSRFEPLAKRIAKMGSVVLAMHPRHSLKPDDGRPYVGDWLANTRADQIGRPLAALRAHDILRGIDLLAARRDVDASSIRAAAYGVEGTWLLLAAAADARIRKVWLDRTPYSLAQALENSIATRLLDAVIPGFLLRWDFDDLVKAMGNRLVLWTDPSNWMEAVVPRGPRFRYRWPLGDLTDMGDAQDIAFLRELLR